MLLMQVRKIFLLFLLIVALQNVAAYDMSGVNATFNFGTITAPFSNLTLTDNNICVGYTTLVEPSTYYVRATSSSSTTTAFQMTNSANNAYTLNYYVSWAGTAGSSPSFVSLASGQNSSSSFPAQLLGSLTCLLLPANSTLQLQLLNTDQVLAKQGSYTDTLTILIVAT